MANPQHHVMHPTLLRHDVEPKGVIARRGNGGEKRRVVGLIAIWVLPLITMALAPCVSTLIGPGGLPQPAPALSPRTHRAPLHVACSAYQQRGCRSALGGNARPGPIGQKIASHPSPSRAERSGTARRAKGRALYHVYRTPKLPLTLLRRMSSSVANW